MPVTDVATFTLANVDVLVDFIDGIQVEYGSNACRDGTVSFQVRALGDKSQPRNNTVRVSSTMK